MNTSPEIPFWKDLGKIFGIILLAVLILSLIFGRQHLSNFFFYSTIITAVIAVIPIFSDVGKSGKAIKAMKKKGVKIEEKDESVIMERLGKDRQGARVTYVYGFVAIVNFFISLFTTQA